MKEPNVKHVVVGDCRIKCQEFDPGHWHVVLPAAWCGRSGDTPHWAGVVSQTGEVLHCWYKAARVFLEDVAREMRRAV